MKTKFLIRSVLLLMITTGVPFLAMAQTDPGCGPDCPIDGGLSLLLAAGVAYGAKKYRDGRKKNEEAEMI